MRKKELLIFLTFSLLSLPVAYFYSVSDFNHKVLYAEQEIKSQVKNIELIQNVLADMPALQGSIEFQSYGQVDIIVEKLMSEDEAIKEFFVLDSELNVLHSKQSNYDDGIVHKESFAGWSKKSSYIYHNDQIYMMSPVGPVHGPNLFFIIFRLSLAGLFDRKLVDSGIMGVSLLRYPEVTPARKFELGTVVLGSAYVDAFVAYLMKNILGLAMIIMLSAFCFIYVLRWLITPFQEITFYLQNLSNRNIEQIKLEHYPGVFKPFIVNIIEANRAIVSAFQREQEIEIQQSQFRVAQQVAHDIRSPLEVLKGLRQELQILPEDSKRRVQMSIQRIEEIAYNLLKTHKSAVAPSGHHAQPEELLSILEGIILEKKMEYSSETSIEIFGDFDSNSYGLLSKVRRGALKSVISNLVNNGIEALDAKRGVIKIKLYAEGEWNVIEVSDTGSGIPEELKEKLFSRGFTSKEKGNGLGLSGAMEEISSVGGKIDFVSTLGVGTAFFIHLPKSEAPLNMVKAIEVYKYKKVVILDDDPAFHEVWRSKLEPIKDKVESYFSIKEIFHKYDELPLGCLLLSDLELMDDEFDGIDVILKYKNSSDSILVTARGEELAIQERCSKEGIMLLSKSIINYIKVNVTRPPIILIDDDKLIRIDWKSYLSSKGIPFKSFASIDNFLEESSSIDKDSLIYIDSSLENGVRGEIESEKIYQLGFLNLFLSTGFQKDDFQKPAWIKDIHSKNPRNFSPFFD